MVRLITAIACLLSFCSVVRAATGCTYIQGYASSRCLAISGASTGNGAGILLFDCLGSTATNEHFIESTYSYVSGGETYHYYTAVNSGKCISVSGASVANGAAVIQWECTLANFPAATNQLFTKISSSRLGYYQLKELHSGKCVSIGSAGTANSSPAVIWDCLDGGNQQFRDYGC